VKWLTEEFPLLSYDQHAAAIRDLAALSPRSSKERGTQLCAIALLDEGATAMNAEGGWRRAWRFRRPCRIRRVGQRRDRVDQEFAMLWPVSREVFPDGSGSVCGESVILFRTRAP
jgi:hypothetical protein